VGASRLWWKRFVEKVSFEPGMETTRYYHYHHYYHYYYYYYYYYYEVLPLHFP